MAATNSEVTTLLRSLKERYDLELEAVVEEILEKGYSTVGIQLPEGLKVYSPVIADHIEERTGVKVITSAEPCYGACDVADAELSTLGAELIVQFGHSEIPSITINKYKIPVMFIETHSTIETGRFIEDIRSYFDHDLKGIQETRNIGITTTVQHINIMPRVIEALKNSGLNCIIGEGDNRIKYHGQVLGCNFSSAISIADKVDCFLFIGSGNFHPLGIALATGQQVMVADPYTREIKDFKELDKLRDRILKQRYGAIARALDANSFGILIGTKSGQIRTGTAERLQRMVSKHNKKAYLIASKNFEPGYLRSFKMDAFVSTACPRIAIDDYLKYDTVILTPIELEIVLGERKWENYEFDQILEPRGEGESREAR